jgi:hypothetical protein
MGGAQRGDEGGELGSAWRALCVLAQPANQRRNAAPRIACRLSASSTSGAMSWAPLLRKTKSRGSTPMTVNGYAVERKRASETERSPPNCERQSASESSATAIRARRSSAALGRRPMQADPEQFERSRWSPTGRDAHRFSTPVRLASSLPSRRGRRASGSTAAGPGSRESRNGCRRVAGFERLQRDQRSASAKRQARQQDRAHDGEDGGVGADARAPG